MKIKEIITKAQMNKKDASLRSGGRGVGLKFFKKLNCSNA
jgi:hypothetical protein